MKSFPQFLDLDQRTVDAVLTIRRRKRSIILGPLPPFLVIAPCFPVPLLPCLPGVLGGDSTSITIAFKSPSFSPLDPVALPLLPSLVGGDFAQGRSPTATLRRVDIHRLLFLFLHSFWCRSCVLFLACSLAWRPRWGDAIAIITASVRHCQLSTLAVLRGFPTRKLCSV